MDRRNGWLPLTLIALLAGGALVPRFGTTPATPSSATDRPAASAVAAPDPTSGNTAFVDQIAQLLNIDIGEPALVRDALAQTDLAPTRDSAEIIRCFFDLDIDHDAAFDEV